MPCDCEYRIVRQIWYDMKGFCVVEKDERFAIVLTLKGDGWFVYASQHSPLLCMKTK